MPGLWAVLTFFALERDSVFKYVKGTAFHVVTLVSATAHMLIGGPTLRDVARASGIASLPNVAGASRVSGNAAAAPPSSPRNSRAS